MTGPATHSSDGDVAAEARGLLDETSGLVESMDRAQRAVLVKLTAMWPTAAWLAAGTRTAKSWLMTYAGRSALEARRLESIAELCARDSRLLDAVAAGRLSLGRAEKLARAVTHERAPWLDASVDVFLRFSGSDDEFAAIVRFWRERVDEHLAPRRVQRQQVVFSERLGGGGDIFCSLSPVSYENACAAIDAFTQDPDPSDAPYKRTLSERRADGIDDLSVFGLTHHVDTDDLDDDELEAEADRAADTYDGNTDGDTLDEAIAAAADEDDADHLELLRRKIRRATEQERRRQIRKIRPRAGATVNAHIDLRTLAGTRDITDLDDLVLHGEGWNLTRRAAEQLLCDSSLVATLFAGKNRVLDANDAAQRFSKRQRRAIAARDHHCVFPGCRRRPQHCDVHHLDERANGGPTRVSNGCLLCRFHHRLLHQHGWNLHQDTDGTWVATDPHGVEWKGRPTHPAAVCASA